MRANSIVVGQKVTRIKKEKAIELRRQMTEEEKILWQHLRKDQMLAFHFRRQQIIDGFIADFYCHVCNLVVEVDGGIHETQIDYDNGRDEILAQRGIRVLRFKNEEVNKDLHDVLVRIAAACTEQYNRLKDKEHIPSPCRGGE